MDLTKNYSSKFLSQNFRKPFIFKDTSSLAISDQSQSLFYTQNIFVNPLALHSLGMIWGSQVDILNPKTGKFAKASILTKDGIQANCLELDWKLKEELGAIMGNRLLIEVKNLKIGKESQSKEEIVKRRNGKNFAYEKNGIYQILGNIIKGKLTIQLKVLKGINSSKVYSKQFKETCQNHQIQEILGLLQEPQNFRVFSENGLIEIIPPEGQSIKIQLAQQQSINTIDTQSLLSIISELTTKINGLDALFGLISQNSQIPHLTKNTNNSHQYSTESSNGSLFSKQYIYDLNQKGLNSGTLRKSKDKQSFLTLNIAQSQTQLSLTLANLQREIEEIKESIQNINTEFYIKKIQAKECAQANAQFHSEICLPPFPASQIQMQFNNFQVEEKMGETNRYVCFKFTHRLKEKWGQVSPHLVKQLELSKEVIKITQTSRKKLFVGLIRSQFIKETSSWQKIGSIGCFLENSQIFANGKEFKREKCNEECLAGEGDIIQVKANRLFNEISWIVNDKIKLMIKIPEFFKTWGKNEEWKTYTEVFDQGDSVQFICRKTF